MCAPGRLSPRIIRLLVLLFEIGAVIILLGVSIVLVRRYNQIAVAPPTHSTFDLRDPERIAAATLGAGFTQTAASLPTPTPTVRVAFTAAPPITSTPSRTPLPSSTPILPRGKIVFTCTPEGFNQLCMLNADGSSYVRLTNRQYNDYYPSFAPDGRSITYVSNRHGQFAVYILDLVSLVESQITDMEELSSATAPEFSPDGSWIVFAMKVWDDSSIWLVAPDGSDLHALTDKEHNEIDPTWSPDGHQIAFAAVRNSYVELFVMNVDGSQIRQVTRDVPRIGGRSSWSPDGKRLVFYAGPKDDRDIYTIEIETGEVQRLTQGGNNTGPCYSPDGEWIIFSSSRDGDHELYLMRADGSGLRQLTANDYDDWQPRWGW
ncbi:MAG: PD40 domain-containing protein [Anaerolineales bacterium]|nr:PD40 domain-containing protein [Anaerolineales bacterium]